MSTNEERRQAAKRKLEQSLAEQQRAARRRLIITASIFGVIVLAAAATGGFFVWKHFDDQDKAKKAAAAAAEERRLFAQCDYQKSTQDYPEPYKLSAKLPADQRAMGEAHNKLIADGKAKQRTSPMPAAKEPRTGSQTLTFNTPQGPIAVNLDRASAPCNVAAVVSLAQNKYYDNTDCHRLSSKEVILQCGDPTGTGAGQPGWTSPDEWPKNLKPAPATQMSTTQQVIYPRGTVAIANSYTEQMGAPSGEHTGSAQVFFAITDIQLPPNYSVIGHVTPDALKVLDAISKTGFTPVGIATNGDQSTGEITEFQLDPSQGAPKVPVTITSVTISPRTAA